MPGCTIDGKKFSACTISVSLLADYKGALVVAGQNPGDRQATQLFTADVVCGPHTPTGTFRASYWETDHVSAKYGALADTPYSKTLMGGNAFGPYQLHIAELEPRGIYVHGTMGPKWNPSTKLNALISPTSHGCIRMANTDIIKLRDLMPNPHGNHIVITRQAAAK